MTFGKKNRKKNMEEEEDNLVMGIQSALASSANRDSVISAFLNKIVPNPDNGRIGQKGLLKALPGLIAAIAESQVKEVPTYEELVNLVPSTPKLHAVEIGLYDNCAVLANTYISNGGYSDSPPKVMPANADGYYTIKTGHRRYIAYLLAEPITKIHIIDILLDKSEKGSDVLIQTVGRLTENTGRVDNTLAEYILELAAVIQIAESRSEPIVKAKLARMIGMERTKLGRIVEIVESGAAEDIEAIYKLHEYGIGDVTAVHLLFKQDRSLWVHLVDELHSIGPVNFRAKYRDYAKPEVKKLPDNVPEHDQSAPPETPVTTTDQGLIKSVAKVEEVTPTYVESENKPEKPEKVKPALKPAEHTENVRLVGAQRLIEIVEQINPDLVADLQGTAEEKIALLIEKLGKV